MKTPFPFIFYHNVFHIFFYMFPQKQLYTKHKSAVSIHLKISCLRISGCAWCSIFRQKMSISFAQESFFSLFLFPPKIWTTGHRSHCMVVLHEGKLCISSSSTWKQARPTWGSGLKPTGEKPKEPIITGNNKGEAHIYQY